MNFFAPMGRVTYAVVRRIQVLLTLDGLGSTHVIDNR